MEIHVKPEHMYDCYICRQDFKQVLGLAEHMHKKCDDYTCPHCQKDFTDKNKTRKHIEQINTKERFYCNDCPDSTTGRDKSSNHVVKHEEAKGFKYEVFRQGKADVGRASKKLDPQEEEGQRMMADVTKISIVSLEERETVAPATTDLETEGGEFELPVGEITKERKHMWI